MRAKTLTGTLPLRYGNSTRNYAVRVGDYHTLVPEEFEEEIGVQQVVIHWAYRPDSSDYDIALVRLQGPDEQCARFSSHVLPACLPGWRERPQKTASNCHVTGWGDTGNGGDAKEGEGLRHLLESGVTVHLGVRWVVRSEQVQATGEMHARNWDSCPESTVDSH